MTRPDLDALAALLDKATPGPWRAQCGEHGAVIVDGPPATQFLIEVTDAPSDGTDQPSADAALIAAAVNALPALIACVRELERERDEARAGMFDGLNHAGALVGRIADQAEEAARVAALAMRERCAQACEERALIYDGLESDASTRYFSDKMRGARTAAEECAAAIRALGA